MTTSNDGAAKLEDLAFRVADLKILTPIRTTRGRIVATFSIVTSRFKISDLRLSLDWDDVYFVSFAKEGQISKLTFIFEEDREELIRVAAKSYEDARKRREQFSETRIASLNPVRASAEVG